MTSAWIIFPFLANSKFNEMARLQRETNRLLKTISEKDEAASRGTKAPPTLEAEKEAATPPPMPAGVYKLD
jgi:hypothetical protein